MNTKDNKDNHAHDTQFPQPAAPHAEEQGDQGLPGAQRPGTFEEGLEQTRVR